MSESDYYEYKKSKIGAKSGSLRAQDFYSDDNEEGSVIGTNKSAPKRKQPAASKQSKQKKPRAKPLSSGWDLGSDDELEDINKHALVSSISRRVADGVTRRTATLKGDVFIEIKVYNVQDIEGVNPKDRWEKAVLALKYQADSDSPELNTLKKVVKLCKKEFTGEGTFFLNKK